MFELLVAVTSLELRTDSPGEPFAPANLAYAGSSWTIEDFADPHLELFADLAPELGDAVTVGITPSIAPDGLSGEELQVLAEMYSQAHRVHYLVSTQGLIEPAKRVVLREHRITPEAFYDFVSNNLLFPAGREYIFARGLSEWIHGDLLVATHLLVPQLENSLRMLLEHAGVATTSLSSEGLQGDRMLGSILAADELEQLLGKGTVFDLKCLLIERFGANLRNLMAHGLAEHASMYSPSASYLCWTVLHLCARSVQARATENGGVEDESED